MAVNLDGIFHLVLVGLTDHVFGNMVLTCTMLMLVFVVVALMLQIPIPFAVAIPIPLAIVFTAYGYLTVTTGGILTAIFLVLAIASFLAGLGIRN